MVDTAEALPEKRSPLAGHRVALAFLMVAYTVSIMDRMILSVLFVPIKAEFGISDAELGLLGGFAFALFYATLGIPIARRADGGNRKGIIVVSLLLFSAMTMLSGLATSLLMLFVLRLFVGVGEAGINPASHSIMADYFPAERLSSAMAILMAGNSLGTIVGFVAGGVISQTYGWRVALGAAGAPGVILAVLMIFFFRAPPHGTFVTAPTRAETPTVLETARTLWGRAATRHLAAALTVQATLSYGLAQWMPAFMVRAHGLSVAQAGTLLGLVVGPVGILGTILGGRLADRAARKGLDHIPGLVALASISAVPLLAIGFQIGNLTIAIAVFLLAVFLANIYFGPAMGLVQTLVPLRMRAVSAALISLSMNLVGLGIGPVVIGSMSDGFEAQMPGHGLGAALSLISLIGLLSGYFFWRCAKAIQAEGA